MPRQFVEVKFKPWQSRSYTYHNDGEPVNVGSQVRVDSRDGWVALEVLSVTDVVPPYETKPILGLHADKPLPPRRPPPKRRPPEQASLFGLPPIDPTEDEMPW